MQSLTCTLRPLCNLPPNAMTGPPHGGGGGWHKALISGCSPLAVPIGLSPLLILTLCGSERVLVVSMGGGGGGGAPPNRNTSKLQLCMHNTGAQPCPQDPGVECAGTQVQRVRDHCQLPTAGHPCCESGTKHGCLWHTFVSE